MVRASTEELVEIPDHTCMGPVDAHQDNMTLDYNLAPGVRGNPTARIRRRI